MQKLTPYKRRYTEEQLEEFLFAMNQQKAINHIKKIAKQYNKFYNMLKIVDANKNGKLEMKFLYPDNRSGYLQVFLTDDEAIVNDSKNNGNFFPYKKGVEVTLKDFVSHIEAVCKYCYHSIFKNVHNDVDARDYTKIRIM